MAFGSGQIIEDTDYTTVYNKIFNVYGRNDDGYGQIMAANPVGNNIIIYHTEWQNLRSYVLNSRVHQIGTSATLNTINQGDVIHYANHLGQINTMADACVTNKRSIHSTQYSSENEKIVIGTSLVWGYPGAGSQYLKYSYRITGANQHGDGAERGLRYFFNAGGKIKLRFAHGMGSGAKTLNWNTLINNIGTITINHNSISASGSTVTPPAGFYGIGAANVEIFRKYASGNGAYTENYFTISANRNTSGTLNFIYTYWDLDTGDKTGQGPAVDEEVNGNMAIYVDQERPSGSYVNVETPTYSTLINWTTTG